MSVRTIRSPWIAGVLAAAIALPNGALLRAQVAERIGQEFVLDVPVGIDDKAVVAESALLGWTGGKV